MALTFRFAEERDTPLILEFIRELADYERLLDQVVADEATLRDQLFEKHSAEVLFALEDGAEVGFALFFHNFSTFLGRAGLYLEDLYVRPEHRGKGHGKALFRQLAAIAEERGCGRLEWWCLDWNTPSIGFYKFLGAEAMEDWTVYRLAGQALRRLAEPEPPVALTHCKKRNKAEIYLCKSCAATVLWKSSEMLGDPRQAVKGKHKGKLCSIPHSIHRPGVRLNRPGRYQILHE